MVIARKDRIAVEPNGAPALGWNRKAVTLLVLVGAVLVVGLTIVHGETTGKHLIDLQVYRKGAWAFIHGRNPYGRGLPGPKLPYTYTPFSTIVFAPLSVMQLHYAIEVHTLVSLAAMFVGLFLVVRELWGTELTPRRLTAVTAGAMVAAYWSEPVLQTLGFGQINLVLMGLVLVDLLAVRNRKYCGVLIGIAAGIKLTPLVFVLYLLATKRYRAAIVASVTAAATVGLGWLFMPKPSSQYFFKLAWDARRIGHVSYIGNQSLYGMWTRLMGNDVLGKPWWQATAAVVVVAGIWAAAEIHRRFGEPFGLGVCAVTGLLISPISWSHHWVWWIVPALMLTRYAWARRSRLLAGLTAAWSLPFYVGPFWRIPYSRWWNIPRFSFYQLLSDTYPILGMIAMAMLVTWLLVSRSAARAGARSQPIGSADSAVGALVD